MMTRTRKQSKKEWRVGQIPFPIQPVWRLSRHHWRVGRLEERIAGLSTLLMIGYRAVDRAPYEVASGR